MRNRHLLGWLIAPAALAAAISVAPRAHAQNCASSNPAEWPPPARPYFMLLFDTSGSMTDPTAANSCKIAKGFPSDYPNTRNGAVRCAMTKTVKAFGGQVNFGLASFARLMSGCAANCFTNCTYSGNICGGARILVPMDPDPLPPAQTPNIANILQYGDNVCTGNTELFADGNTPLGASLQNLLTYFQSGFGGNPSPLSANDPSCRSINVIMLTDGAETCSGNPITAAAALYSPGVTISGKNWPVRVNVIDAAAATPSTDNVQIATAGHGVARGAVDEAALSAALAEIIGGAIKAEVCDNTDNDCNGCIDEGYKRWCHRNKTPTASPTDSSQCCSAAHATCVANYLTSITTSNPTGDRWLLPCWTPTDLTQPITGASNSANWLCHDPGDSCDNLENNCEGTTPNASVVDEAQTKCNGHCPIAETCNGQDDDCNGIMDEAPGNPAPYSLPGCTKCTPSGEVCDGCDNDCDGFADNGVPTVPCGIPTPANCAGVISCMTPENVGVGKCIGGAPSNRWAACSNSPSAEVCDGVDNNCNGTIDEGIAPAACEVPGQPGLVYQDGFAQSICVRGQQACNGICSGWVGPTQEICDGLDNDCDGLVDAADTDMAGAGQVCGSALGTCTKGISVCINAVLICQGGSSPQPELCDGKDNDCNGFVDDGTLLDAPPAAEKPCWNLPAGSCTTDCSYVGAAATTLWCPPLGANCHDLGTLMGPPCAPGALSCLGASWKCLGSTLPASEACDGVDNNCNGDIDDGLLKSPCGTNVGECKLGVQNCAGGVVSCNGAVGPTTEICDGKDNDCDGVNDNGISLGTPCQPAYDAATYPGPRDKGICQPGVTECNAKFETICAGGKPPSPEVCDGLDNDCDGQVDESGAPPNGINGTADPNDPSRNIGTDCGKQLGACKPGKWACSSGQFVCSGGVAPQPEVCDCVDNDCDGLIDEDPKPNTGEPVLCSTGKACVEYNGGCQCAAKCGTGEFPCPTGAYVCQAVDKSGTEPAESAGNRCVTEPCKDCSTQSVISAGKIECAPLGTVLDGGEKPPQCQCKGQAGCHNPCYGVSCTAPMVCTDFGLKAGECVTDSCWNVPCQLGQACNQGSCVNNPCKANSCKATEGCKPNADFTKAECKASCAAISCKTTEQCVDGKCVATGCSQPCPIGQVCTGGDAGACIKSKCDPNPCTDGSWCNPATGSCGNDPCSGVLCPSAQTCANGQCVKVTLDGGTDADGSGGKGGSSHADAGGKAGSAAAGGLGPQGVAGEDRGRWGLATGGGGCACTLPVGIPKTASSLALAAAAVTLLALRRRKRGEEE